MGGARRAVLDLLRDEAVSRLARSERTTADGWAYLVGGTRGVVEYRGGRGYAYFAVHSPRPGGGWPHHSVPGPDGVLKRGCCYLEGGCWTALVDGLGGTGWEVLERVYETYLEGRR